MQEVNPPPQPPFISPGGKLPLLGLIAILIAVVSTKPLLGVFALLAILLGIIALFKKQYITGTISVILAIVSLVTSPLLWAGVAGYFVSKHVSEQSDFRDVPGQYQQPAVPEHQPVFPPVKESKPKGDIVDL